MILLEGVLGVWVARGCTAGALDLASAIFQIVYHRLYFISFV